MTLEPNSSQQAGEFASKLMELTDAHLLPLLPECIAQGHTPFGAGIFRKSDFSPVAVSSNKDLESPVLHAEVNCINQFFKLPEPARPSVDDALFISTHEPCSMCLSALAWANVKTVYFTFTHQDTRDKLGMNEDIDIIEELFLDRGDREAAGSETDGPRYNRRNKFFTAAPISSLFDAVADETLKDGLKDRMNQLQKAMLSASSTLQTTGKD